MSDFLSKLCCLRYVFLISLLTTGAQVWADDHPGDRPLQHNNDKKAERIAPALKTLVRNFKADNNSEAQIILRKTQVHIDEQLMSHATAYVAIYINSDEAVRDYSQISVSFNSFYEDIALEFANVRTPDGKMVLSYACAPEGPGRLTVEERAAKAHAFLMAAAERGWLDGDKAMMEGLLAFKRAGASGILTYFAPKVARMLSSR